MNGVPRRKFPMMRPMLLVLRRKFSTSRLLLIVSRRKFSTSRLLLIVPIRKFSTSRRDWYWLYQGGNSCSGGSFYNEALAEVCVKVVFCYWKEVALMTKFFLVEAFIQVLDLKLNKFCFMFKFQDILWKEFFRRWFMDYAQDRVLFLK